MESINENKTILSFNDILRLGYHVGFSDGYGYILYRDYKDDPFTKNFYNPPVQGNIEIRLESADEADDREKLYKRLKS